MLVRVGVDFGGDSGVVGGGGDGGCYSSVGADIFSPSIAQSQQKVGVEVGATRELDGFCRSGGIAF